MRELFLEAARGQRTERPPVWLMRQAGRYLPEYRQIRSEHTFLEAIGTPEIAEEISLQPWNRFKPDGVVMYSDILVILDPIGFDYRIESGIGPVIESPIETPGDVEIEPGPVDKNLEYVGELLRRLQDRLAGRAAVIGFTGGPFTIAAYLVDGRPTRSFMGVRRFRFTYPEAFQQLLEIITDIIVEYVRFQVRNGADVIQLFDTYAGLLSPSDYRSVLLPLHRRIIDAIDESVPTIIFGRNLGPSLELVRESGADVVGLDWTVEMDSARKRLGDVPVQGNLDPAVLFADESYIQEQTRAIIDAAGPKGHILNLGHGVDQATSVRSVEKFVETAKSIDR